LSDKNIKKTFKIGLSILGTLGVLIFSSWLILQSPVVQTYLTHILAEHLSEKYNTTVTVKGVSIAFFNKIVLQDVLIEDQKHDSLLFVQELVANVDSFSIKRFYVGINQLKLNKTVIHIDTDSLGTPNYEFLVKLLKTKDTLKIDSVNFDLTMKRFEFNDAKVRYSYYDPGYPGRKHRIYLNDICLGISDMVTHNGTIAFQINRLQMNNGKDFELQDFSAHLIATPDSVYINKLHIQTPNSVISEANIRIDKSKTGPELDPGKIKFSLELKKSVVGLKDIALLVPSLKGMDEKIEVSGLISGTPVDLKGKNIELSLGENTRLSLDFYMNGLPDISKTYMHVDLKRSFADLNDIEKVKLPTTLEIGKLNIPDNLLQAGVIEYNGNFTGFLSDFVAFGTFRSKWGVLTTDLSFLPSKGEKLKINGKLKTIDFMAGKLLQTEILDRVTFNGNIEGILNPKTQDFNATVSGQIDSIQVNNYTYKDIRLNGDIQNRKFDGKLVVNDTNLKFSFDGEFDLNIPVPVFNFNMLVEKADLKALNLISAYKKAEISFALNANFTGNNIDNLAGFIHFKEGHFMNENGVVAFDNFDLKTFNEPEPLLQLRSDFLEADIRGKYQLHNLPYTVKSIIARYLPSSGIKIPVQKVTNDFDFRLVLKDINRFAKVLVPDLIMEPAKLEGSISSDNNTLVLNAGFPQIQYKSSVLKNVTVTINGDSKLNIRNKVDEIDLGEQFKVYNLSLISEASDDVMDSKLAWNNFGEVSYSGSINTSTKFIQQKNYPHLEISVKPTRIYFADSLWQINSALITVDSTLIRFNKLKLSSHSQSITADGSIDKSTDKKLNILFNQIDLNSLNAFIAGDLELKGELDGSLSLFDVYRRTLFLSDLKIAGLGIIGQPIGDASIQSRWDTEAEEINAELDVKSGEKNTLHAFGIYNPGRDSLSIHTNFDHFSLLILQPLLGSAFANFHGDATGKVRLYGPLNALQHTGALYASNAGLMLSDLQVNYNLSDSVRFAGNQIIFPEIRITDDLGNQGVFSGTIKHRSFSNMVYDLSIKSKKIMAFNTTPKINEAFYGKLFGSGIVRITGNDDKLLIDGTARTEKGTEMNISLDYSGEAQEYNFLNFVSRGYQIKQEDLVVPYSGSDLQMKFNVEVTPEAKVQLIYNSKIGDVIRSQGSGNMQVGIDNNGSISLFGEYTFEQGDYLFTLQNVINKKFEIQRGGTIQWNGDPMDATVNLNAIYHLKASLSELFASNVYENKDFAQRLPVLCKINLSNSLNNPDIKFDIELPTAEDRIKDEVKQYISSDEDMNKQMLSLLVLGKFYTPEYLRGTYTSSNNNLVGSTASELLSNQFSNWLSQISNDFDIGVNYRPGNQITNDEVELALSTQLFNDRVTINGNIGNNSALRTNVNSNSNSFVGDADVNVKITNNGKLQLKAYNRANNNLIYETSPYTQGVGLSYREDFNDINELWRKLKSILKWKKARKDSNKIVQNPN